ncbi:hypothetical protein DK846_09330 [Methanospirillum lacunae]|uniref:Uncharacterized protein n=1 Tax=Methanospirillum lacunae TaxID=668570 RepID=A0A2V2N6R8_9EURY|nr:hypothetical protein DK846_09330 [Methanospirillum lacunae]
MFEIDKLPSNSDVTIMLSQYLESMERYRCENIKKFSNDWIWITDDYNKKVKTYPPKKFHLRGL